jgi:hypothetical protein
MKIKASLRFFLVIAFLAVTFILKAQVNKDYFTIENY